MAVSHHPSATTLTEFADGNLAPGASLVVTLHLQLCTECRGYLSPVPVPQEAILDRAGGAQTVAAPQIAVPDEPPATRSLSPSLDAYRISRPRWAGPGMSIAQIPGAAGLGERVYVLTAAPGRRLPRHGHDGAERVVVLEGAFDDGGVVYGVGDVCEAEGRLRHSPKVAAAERCVCLVATECPLQMSGAARLLQRLLGV